MQLANERQTLLAVAANLRAGVYPQFNMSSHTTCIGALAWLHENPADFSGASNFVLGADMHWENPLWNLFYGHTAIPASEHTAVAAASAIDNYLVGNPLPWEEGEL